MTKKSFDQLTPQGQTRRLNKYEQERAERGTEQVLARLVRPAKINQNKDGSQSAVFRFAVNETGQPASFFTASAYIAKDKDSLQEFYQNGLKTGDLVSVEYKTVKGYNNIYNLMNRQPAVDAKRQEAKEQAPALVVN